MDAFCLQFLAKELNNTISGGKISKISMPFQDEIILSIYCEKSTKNLLISANPSLCRAVLTKEKFENPKNAFNFLTLLRKHLSSAVLQSIEQQPSERVLFFQFLSKNELFDIQKRTLCYECTGRSANLILLDEKDKILGAVKTNSLDDNTTRKVIAGEKYEPLRQENKLNFDDYEEITKFEEQNIVEFLTVMVKGIGKKTAEVLYEEMQNTGKKLTEVLQNPPEILKISSEKIESGLLEKSKTQRQSQQKKPLETIIKNNLNKIVLKINKIEQTIEAAKDFEKYRIIGELITNNIYQLKRGQKTATLFNYYDNSEIEINLDEKLSPGENAKRYFKKANKLKIAGKLSQGFLAEALTMTENLQAVKFALSIAKNNEEIDEIALELEELKLIPPQNKKKKKQMESSFLHYNFQGFDIYAGKNNLQNARLLKSANGNDIWLHAQGVPGSHTVIVSKNKEIPQEVIKFGAQIAAFYSKNRNETKAAVDYTFVKFVKKIPASPLGFVTFTNNKTIIVECSEVRSEGNK